MIRRRSFHLLFRQTLPALFCLASGLAVPRALALDESKPAHWVTDDAGIIDATTRQKMERLLSDLERQAGFEVAVVTLKSLEGDSIENAANTLFNRWKIGKKGEDNGVLILVAVEDRKVRIETGYGVEAILPDGACGDIVREHIVPYFKDGRYSDGLYQGTTAVIYRLIRDKGVLLPGMEKLPAPRKTNRGDATGASFIVVLFLSFVLGKYLRNRFKTPAPSGWVSLGPVLFGGLDALFLWHSFVALNNILLFSILCVLGIVALGVGFFVKSTPRPMGWYGGGPGGFSGRGRFGGGFGGFGGGFSGGGGASGSW
ncbi:MAG TPA: TPM domain-containing protein [Elusimicrobiota bacterium]|nr:TPM domain-containing protein [Elusimicrobiota bacterium]